MPPETCLVVDTFDASALTSWCLKGPLSDKYDPLHPKGWLQACTHIPLPPHSPLLLLQPSITRFLNTFHLPLEWPFQKMPFCMESGTSKWISLWMINLPRHLLATYFAASYTNEKVMTNTRVKVKCRNWRRDACCVAGSTVCQLVHWCCHCHWLPWQPLHMHRVPTPGCSNWCDSDGCHDDRPGLHPSKKVDCVVVMATEIAFCQWQQLKAGCVCIHQAASRSVQLSAAHTRHPAASYLACLDLH